MQVGCVKHGFEEKQLCEECALLASKSFLFPARIPVRVSRRDVLRIDREAIARMLYSSNIRKLIRRAVIRARTHCAREREGGGSGVRGGIIYYRTQRMINLSKRRIGKDRSVLINPALIEPRCGCTKTRFYYNCKLHI